MPHKKNILLEGKPIPSVTEVFKIIEKPFLWDWYRRRVEANGFEGWLECEKRTKDGASIGTKFHEAIEFLLENKPLDVNQFTPQIRGMAISAYKYLLEKEYQVISFEEHKIHPIFKFHGCSDLVVKDGNGFRGVLDWKTSKTFDLVFGPIQLGAYAILENCIWGELIHIDRKPPYKIKIETFENLEEYKTLFIELLDFYHYLNDKGFLNE